MTTVPDVKIFANRHAADLVTDVNAWLATLATDARIYGFSTDVEDQTRRIGIEYRILIHYEASGGTPVVGAWMLRVDEDATLAALNSALTTFMSTAGFTTTPQLHVLDSAANNKLDKWTSLLLYNGNRDAYQNFGPTTGFTPLPH